MLSHGKRFLSRSQKIHRIIPSFLILTESTIIILSFAFPCNSNQEIAFHRLPFSDCLCTQPAIVCCETPHETQGTLGTRGIADQTFRGDSTSLNRSIVWSHGSVASARWERAVVFGVVARCHERHRPSFFSETSSGQTQVPCPVSRTILWETRKISLLLYPSL